MKMTIEECRAVARDHRDASPLAPVVKSDAPSSRAKRPSSSAAPARDAGADMHHSSRPARAMVAVTRPVGSVRP